MESINGCLLTPLLKFIFITYTETLNLLIYQFYKMYHSFRDKNWPSGLRNIVVLKRGGSRSLLLGMMGSTFFIATVMPTHRLSAENPQLQNIKLLVLTSSKFTLKLVIHNKTDIHKCLYL